jgi:hypothetical protein
VVENGRVTVIADEQGRPIVPSFVGIGEDGAVLVGEPAKNQYVLYPNVPSSPSSAAWEARRRWRWRARLTPRRRYPP